MNVKGIRGNGIAAGESDKRFKAEAGGVNVQFSDSSRSAEPDEDVDARLPC